MKIRTILFVTLLFLLFYTLNAQVFSVDNDLNNQDLIRTFDDGTVLTITKRGEVSYKNFKYQLFDHPEEFFINDYIGYTSFKYDDYIVSCIYLDKENGGENYYLFANYKTGEIIFHQNIFDFPSGLMDIVGHKNRITFIYSGGLASFNTISDSFSWKNIWNDYFNDDQYDRSLSIDDYFFREDFITIYLYNREILKFDYINSLER